MFFLPYNDDVHASDVDCKPPPAKFCGRTRFLIQFIDKYHIYDVQWRFIMFVLGWKESTIEQVKIEKQRKREAYQCMNPETSIQVKRTHLAKKSKSKIYFDLEWKLYNNKNWKMWNIVKIW